MKECVTESCNDGNGVAGAGAGALLVSRVRITVYGKTQKILKK